MELFWNTHEVKLSPVLNTKNKLVAMTAVRGSDSPNDLTAYYQVFTHPPKQDKKKHPTLKIKSPIPKRHIPLLWNLDQKHETSLWTLDQKPKPASPVPTMSDQELRLRFAEITTKRRYSLRRIGFGNLCYAQERDPDCSKTMWSGALFYAVQENELKKVKKLLKNGEDPNAKDLDGKTPLFHVMHDPKMILLLCKYGADPNITDNNGFSPLIVARAYQVGRHAGNSFVNALLKSGAKE